MEAKKTDQTITRRFFHEDRQPNVFFSINGQSYSGTIADMWNNGFRVIVPKNFIARIGDTISVMFIEKLEKEYAMENLQISRVRYNNVSEHTTLTIFFAYQPLEKRLAEILELITEEKPVKISQHFNIKRVPSYTGDKHYSREAVEGRLKWARGVSGLALDHLPRTGLNPERLAGNIENYIGAVEVPVGLAGPVLVNGAYAAGYIPLPIATTEGALISSITRGAWAINQCGGVQVHVIRQQMLRAPVFFCQDIHGAVNLEKWVAEHVDSIKEKANSVSSTAKLVQITPFVFAETVHLKFYYKTGDAAGQNMTTSCTWFACQWLEEQIKENPFIKYKFYVIEGNTAGDKKVSFQGFNVGRGVSVTATAWVSNPVLKRVFRTDARATADAFQAAEVGALHSGMIGHNINFANIIAGIFTATGQDIACVHESSCGILKFREENNGLLMSIYLPALVIGTVGGGTNLPAQKECLELMGCHGQGKLFRFAEIIASACLALDLSTATAILTNEFVNAHEKLGRNRSGKALGKSEINPVFFNRLMKNEEEVVTAVEEKPLSSANGIVTSLAGKNKSRMVGLFRYMLALEARKQKKERHLTAVLKLKSSHKEMLNIALGVARLSGEDRLPGLFEAYHEIFDFHQSDTREITFYTHANKDILAYCPTVYGTRIDNDREIFAILMEDLSPHSHLNRANDPEVWDRESIQTVLEGLADIHAVYFDRFDAVPAEIPLNPFDAEKKARAAELIRDLTAYNRSNNPHLITHEMAALLEDFLDHFPGNLEKMQEFPMTLTHNDFNPRNICLRKHRQGGRQFRLLAYDWELAAFRNPQHDLIEFLVFVMPENAPVETFDHYARFYLEKLERKTNRAFPDALFFETLRLNAIERALIRFNLYLIIHRFEKFDFIDRVYTNLRRYIIRACHHEER